MQKEVLLIFGDRPTRVWRVLRRNTIVTSFHEKATPSLKRKKTLPWRSRAPQQQISPITPKRILVVPSSYWARLRWTESWREIEGDQLPRVVELRPPEASAVRHLCAVNQKK